MKIETKKDMLGKYTKITYPNSKVEIIRFFKELGISVNIIERYGKTA